MKFLDILNEETPSDEYVIKQKKKVKSVFKVLNTGTILMSKSEANDNEIPYRKYKYVLNDDYQVSVGVDNTIVFIFYIPIKYNLYEIIDGNELYVDPHGRNNVFIYRDAWKMIADKFMKFNITLR